jgi:hypothetical protein
MGVDTVPEELRRTLVQEFLTNVHDQFPDPFVVTEITEYLNQEEVWDDTPMTIIEALILHLHGFHCFLADRSESKVG